ncbi:MAG: hypothetical protein J1G06_06200 [Oscillospiraceae bacterium]|nr:hypothetical protein [Oscillospiraceae bacterium]
MCGNINPASFLCVVLDRYHAFFNYEEISIMHALKTNTKLIILLLSAAVLLSSCSLSTSKPAKTLKSTPSPAVSTQSPAATEKPATATPQPSDTSSETTYILNMHTKKFHSPSCSSVNDMNEKNKRKFTGTRDKVIAQGYTPCKRCDP